ncbi:MAG: hypothetical protein JXR37_27800 [Kiritimatiellae bacterium]|nr:hypothetical protein [Kiritimatiellia bacterium]
MGSRRQADGDYFPAAGSPTCSERYQGVTGKPPQVSGWCDFSNLAWSAGL